jgi:hypothetical protein
MSVESASSALPYDENGNLVQENGFTISGVRPPAQSSSSPG